MYNKKLDQVIEFIDSNKSNHDIKTMCTVLDVTRSTYYRSKSGREVENEGLKSAIKRIYNENKGIYGVPRIYHILGTQGFNVSFKRVQRKITELSLCSITVKNTNLIQIKSQQKD